jgi:hypothetical protein
MRTILILGIILTILFGGCVKEKMYFVSGHIYTDCETRAPFANKNIRLWDDFRKKVIGTGSTDENGYFRFEYSNNYQYLVLQGVSPYFSIAKDIVINPDNNQNTEFFLNATYNLKVYLDVVNQNNTYNQLRYLNKVTYKEDTLYAPFSNQLLYLGKAGIIEPSYPKSREQLNFIIDNNFNSIYYDVEKLCSDTISLTIRIE